MDFRIDGLTPVQFIQCFTIEERKAFCKKFRFDFICFYRAMIEVAETGQCFDATIIKEKYDEEPNYDRNAKKVEEPPRYFTQIVADVDVTYFDAPYTEIKETNAEGEETYKAYCSDRNVLIKV